MSIATPRDDEAQPVPDASDAGTVTDPGPESGLTPLTDLGGGDAPVCVDGVCLL